MCCSTGVCGPDADDELVTVSKVLRKLERQGATVERYNPASHPEMFTDTPVVHDALQREGQDVLPIVLIDGRIQSRWSYPSREEFARMAGLEPPAGARSAGRVRRGPGRERSRTCRP